jgi:hypothetical protein
MTSLQIAVLILVILKLRRLPPEDSPKFVPVVFSLTPALEASVEAATAG